MTVPSRNKKETSLPTSLPLVSLSIVYQMHFMEEYEEKKKKILLKKKELEQKIQKEKNEKILQAVRESFGEINEKNMGTFLELLKKNSEEFSLEMKIASEESHEETEMNVPNFGTQQDNESNPYPFSEN